MSPVLEASATSTDHSIETNSAKLVSPFGDIRLAPLVNVTLSDSPETDVISLPSVVQMTTEAANTSALNCSSIRASMMTPHTVGDRTTSVKQSGMEDKRKWLSKKKTLITPRQEGPSSHVERQAEVQVEKIKDTWGSQKLLNSLAGKLNRK